MSKAKRWVASTLALALAASALAGCAGGDAPGSSAGSSSPGASGGSAGSVSSSEPVELSLCLSQTSWGNSVDPDLMEAFKQKIEEATNTKIEMISPPHNDYREKLNVLLTSGEIPDVYQVQLALDTVPLYALRGYAAPLDEYVEADPRFDVLDEFDLSGLSVDGKLYGLPNNRVMNKIIWVRQDMIDQYGLNIKEEMTTQEFVDEMSKIDQSQVIPFTFPKWTENFQLFYNFFGAYAGIVKGEDGKYYDGFQTQEMKDAILYIKSLYDAGILDKEFITNENSMMREKTFTGKAASTCDYYYQYLYFLSQADGVDKATDFVPIYTLVGPNGDKGNLNESFQNAMSVSPKCANIEKAVEVISWLYYSEEGTLLTKVGVEGQHYTIENGVITPTEKAANSGYSINAGNFTLSMPIIEDLPFQWGGVQDDGYAKQLEAMEKSQAEGVLGPKYNVTMGISDLYDKNVATYNATIKETVTKVVIGNATLEQAYEDYAGFWQSIQGDEMLNQLNAAQ